MKHHIEKLLQTALAKLQQQGQLSIIPASIQVEATKDKKNGDFASNVAMVLAKPLQKNPRDIANSIIQALPESAYFTKVDIAGPGFINFFLSPSAFYEVVKEILQAKNHYGRCQISQNKRVMLEFVSSNPTGPLHVGHGRHAAYGDILANLLEAIGFMVQREYYVNDAGRQMDILATSLWLRYLELYQEAIIFPANGYQGDYLREIAHAVQQKYAKQFVVSAQAIFQNLPLDEPAGGDKELYIDAVIERAKTLLGDNYPLVLNAGLEAIMADIREDVSEFGVHFQIWFSERQLVQSGAVNKVIEKLRQENYLYEREGALWFRSTDFGDEKDRVLVRSNGQHTYFANDIAHHLNKFDEGIDLAMVVLGADHHGYIARVKAAVRAYGIDPERFICPLVQFVKLYRGEQPVPMSTRGGNFVTLRELRKEVGNDAARFFYVMRKCEQPMDFDLELAKSQSNENPVYYVQYAHARICSVFKQVAERGMAYDEAQGIENVALLSGPSERELINTLSHYPDMIIHAAIHYEPHLLTHYLRELATHFHAYYNACQFIVEDNRLRNARLSLVAASKQVLVNGLNLLGVTALDSM